MSWKIGDIVFYGDTKAQEEQKRLDHIAAMVALGVDEKIAAEFARLGVTADDCLPK
jgi:hypothetical protein